MTRQRCHNPSEEFLLQIQERQKMKSQAEQTIRYANHLLPEYYRVAWSEGIIVPGAQKLLTTSLHTEKSQHMIGVL